MVQWWCNIPATFNILEIAWFRFNSITWGRGWGEKENTIKYREQSDLSEFITAGVKDNLRWSYGKSQSFCHTSPELLSGHTLSLWRTHMCTLKISEWKWSTHTPVWCLKRPWSTMTCPVWHLTVELLSLKPGCMLDMVPCLLGAGREILTCLQVKVSSQ